MQPASDPPPTLCNAETPTALYVHVPFCRAKCRYCDFHSRPLSEGSAEKYLRALRVELGLWRPWCPSRFSTAFLGGGTPTALPPVALDGLLQIVGPLLADGAELTVEANPATVTEEIAAILSAGGVARVSLGAQSFDDDRLAMLGRLHRARDVGPALDRLRAAGIGNLSLDLIYALPNQTVDAWRADLDAAVAMGVSHVSCYALSFETGTPLWDDLQAGRVESVDEDTQAAMYAATRETLAAAGFEQYELSNFARPGRACRHNRVYWHNRPYIGVGPAAASYVAGQRRTNVADTGAWQAALAAGHWPPADAERLTGLQAAGEALMLALRLVEGVDDAAFAARYGDRPEALFRESIARQLSIGALTHRGDRLAIAPEHYFTADAILADILAEAG